MFVLDLFDGMMDPKGQLPEAAREKNPEPEQQQIDVNRDAALRREREPAGSDKIDAMLAAQHQQRQEYEKSGKFWLKTKSEQKHIQGPFIGKAAANEAARQLLAQAPELRGNLLITAWGPGEQQSMEESDVSGLLAASRLNRSFIITVQTAEGHHKKFRVKAQSERVAKEKFQQHHSQAKILSVKEEGGQEMEEGYRVVPDFDRDKYQERQGLEGPFHTKSGKVVYYDKQEGKYYDPDTDMYIEYSDWQAMNEQAVSESVESTITDIIEYLRSDKPGLDKESFLDWMYTYLDASGGKQLADHLMSRDNDPSYDEWYANYSDLAEGKTGPGLWANIHAKRKRIKNGSGEQMRKPGSKGAPSAQNFKDAASEGVAEGGYPEVDHMPGPTIKRTQTGCKRCHGKGYVYKTPDGEVHPMNRPDAKKYKCGKCSGIGFVKVAEQGVAEGLLNEFAPGGNTASSYYAVTANFVNDFAQQKQEELQDLIDSGWTKQDLAQAGTLQSQAADIAHFEQVRDGFLKGLKPGFDAYLQGDTQLKDQLGAYWQENDLPLNQDWEKIYGEPWGRDNYGEGVAEGYSNTTFNVDRRKLNVPALIQKGAILVTHPHGEQGWETDNKEDWAFSLLSLYNVLQGGWASEAKKYLKPESYKRAEQQINSSAPNLGSDKLVYDGKYNQILWSIKKLGIPDNVAFLDKDKQGVAEGPGFDKWADDRAASQLHKLKPGMVQDRKTGKWYEPKKEFDKKMNSPEVMAQMKRMAQKEGVAEGGFKNVTAIFSGYSNYMRSRAPNVFRQLGIKVLNKEYNEDQDIIEYTVISDRDSLDKARATLETNKQFGGMILQKKMAEGVPGETPANELERLKLRQNAEHGSASLKRQVATQARIRELEKQIADKKGVAEANTPSDQPRIRKYSKIRADGSKAERFEVLDYLGRRVQGQGPEGFDDPKAAKEFFRRNYIHLTNPMSEESLQTKTKKKEKEDPKNSDKRVLESKKRYWCSTDKRWKDVSEATKGNE